MSAALPPAVPGGAAGAPPASGDVRRAIVRIAVWDLPTRLFHWALVAAVTAAVITGLIGGNAMVWHGRAGLAIVGLLAFRIVWGVVGGAHARFASFVPGPRRLLAYLRGRWRGHGHNPLGALSVIALLVLLAAQVATGLLGNDEIAFAGPLAGLVDDTLSIRLTGLHHQLSQALYAWLALHLGAIAWHRLARRERLIGAMITGRRAIDAAHATDGIAAIAPRRAGTVALVFALGIALAAVYAASGTWIAAAPAAVPAPPPVSLPASAPAW